MGNPFEQQPMETPPESINEPTTQPDLKPVENVEVEEASTKELLKSLRTRIQQYSTLMGITLGADFQSMRLDPARNRQMEASEALKNDFKRLKELLLRAESEKDPETQKLLTNDLEKDLDRFEAENVAETNQ